MSYPLFRNLLFYLDAENAHHLIMGLSSMGLNIAPIRRFVSNRYQVKSPCLVQNLHGLKFDHPIGMAAGFDKNAQFLNVLPNFGFSSIEIGTVTAEGQPGNARPRLFRLPKDQAILNRMGFNNHGRKLVAKRLQRLPTDLPFRLGVNIGKTKVVPIDQAEDDYIQTFEALFDYMDYLTVNVSSPNTPNLRELQEKDRLKRLLSAIQRRNMALARERRTTSRPLFVKIAPDLSEDAILDVINVVRDVHGQGVIATNTTVSREGLSSQNVQQLGPGGISGIPIQKRSREVVKFIYRNAPDLTIIGVGGIFNGEDALKMIRAGATLVQLWTGFIYQGPRIVHDINQALIRACKKNRWNNISEAIGIDAEDDD